MTLEMTSEEMEALRDLIDRHLTELSVEIHRTDSPYYRERLERENETLTALQQRLPAASVNR